MDDLRNALVANSPGLVIGTVTTVLVAVFFYLRGRRMKRPCWDVRTTTLVRDYESRLPGLAVTFDGDRVQSLAVSRLAFWNAGNETILASDFESFSHVRVVATPDIEILDVVPIADNMFEDGSRQTSGDTVTPRVQTERSSEGWLLNLRYLEPGKGVVLQVMHTASKRESRLDAGISVAGSVIGAAKLQRRSRPRLRVPRRLGRALSGNGRGPERFGWLYGLTYGFMGAVLIGMGVYTALTPVQAVSYQPYSREPNAVVFVAMGVFIMALGGLLVWVTRPRIPAGLEALHERVI